MERQILELKRYLSPDELANFKTDYGILAAKAKALYDKRPQKGPSFQTAFNMAAYLHAINAPKELIWAALGQGLMGGYTRELTEKYLSYLAVKEQRHDQLRLRDETSQIMGIYSDLVQSPVAETNQRAIATAHINPHNLSASLLRSVHLLFTLHENWDKDERYAQLSRNWYAPFTYALGHRRLSRDLQDKIFELSEPEDYSKVHEVLVAHENAITSSDDFKSFRRRLSRELLTSGLREGKDYYVEQRPKSVASTATKMHDEKLDFDDVSDLYGMRIILLSDKLASGQIDHEKTVKRCYLVKSALERVVKKMRGVRGNVPHEPIDYIRNPKPPQDPFHLLSGSSKVSGYQGINFPLVHDKLKVALPDGGEMPAHIEVQIMGDFHQKNNEFGWGSRLGYKHDISDEAKILLDAIGRAKSLSQPIEKAISDAVRLVDYAQHKGGKKRK